MNSNFRPFCMVSNTQLSSVMLSQRSTKNFRRPPTEFLDTLAKFRSQLFDLSRKELTVADLPARELRPLDQFDLWYGRELEEYCPPRPYDERLRLLWSE